MGIGTCMPIADSRRRFFMVERVPLVSSARRSSSFCTSRNRSFEIKSFVRDSMLVSMSTFSSTTALCRTATARARPLCLEGTKASVAAPDRARRKLVTTDVRYFIVDYKAVIRKRYEGGRGSREIDVVWYPQAADSSEKCEPSWTLIWLS
jgi:hypothetical protein